MISYLAVVLFCTPQAECFFYNRNQTFDKLEQCQAFVREVEPIIAKQYRVVGAQCLKVDAGRQV